MFTSVVKVNFIFESYSCMNIFTTVVALFIFTDVVGFSSADSESLRENFNVLMKDGDRRQSLIQDLILTNNQLRYISTP